jgi:uncharacterized damage-inducible protein DinB
MHVSIQTLQTHLDYTIWATSRLLSSAAELSPEELQRDFATSDRSVLGTLSHIFAADRVWLARIQGGPPEHFTYPEAMDLVRLADAWEELFGRWQAWAEDLTDDAAETRISYKDIRGNAWASPLWQILLHVVNHGTHHRGQVSGFLRAMGKTPPPLDLTAYYREKDPSQRQ